MIAVIAAAGAVGQLRRLSGWESTAGRSQSYGDAARSTPDPTTGVDQAVDSPSPSAQRSEATDGWTEQWRIDSGMRTSWQQSGDWNFLSTGNHVVIYSSTANDASTIQIFKVSSGQPIKTAEIPSSGYFPSGINKRLLFYDHGFIDLETGVITEGTWGIESPIYVTDDLAITCSEQSSTCTAWDIDDGTLTQRWSQPYPGNRIDAQKIQRMGDNQTGYLAITDPTSRYTTRFLSLADGTIPNSQTTNSIPNFIVAADGWLSIDPNNNVTILSPAGKKIDSFPPPESRSTQRAALVAPETGVPTVKQLRQSYESQDTSWARTSILCSRFQTCLLNGTPPEVLTSRYCTFSGYLNGDLQNSWVTSPDGEFLFLLPSKFTSTWGKNGTCVINTEKRTVTNIDGATVPNGDLVIVAEGTALVGYSPSHKK